MRPASAETFLYVRVALQQIMRSMDFDMNWWGLWAVPLGVAICFGPVIVAWALSARKDQSKAESRSIKSDRH